MFVCCKKYPVKLERTEKENRVMNSVLNDTTLIALRSVPKKKKNRKEIDIARLSNDIHSAR